MGRGRATVSMTGILQLCGGPVLLTCSFLVCFLHVDLHGPVEANLRKSGKKSPSGWPELSGEGCGV